MGKYEDKAIEFANHLSEVFQPFKSVLDSKVDDDITTFLDAPYQMSPPTKNMTKDEVMKIIKTIKPTKAPGYDLITGQILRELPENALRLITAIFNCVMLNGCFPGQWKIAQIILIAKPGKPMHDVKSYRPISLLPVLSKVFEKIFSKRLQTYLKEIIPEHQFGFREQHATVEQIHRVVNTINLAFEKKLNCSATFLNISRAFYKVWPLMQDKT